MKPDCESAGESAIVISSTTPVIGNAVPAVATASLSQRNGNATVAELIGRLHDRVPGK